MKLRLLISISILAITAGCQTNPAYQREIAVLRGEIIDLEDKYYALKSDYEMATAELASCRGESSDNSYYKAPSNGSGGGDSRIEELPKSSDPRNNNPGNGDDNLPMIDDGDVQSEPGSGTGNLPQDAIMIGASDRREIPIKQNPQSWVSRIRISKRLSRGENLDGKPGDDGIVLVVQPLDEQGNVVTGSRRRRPRWRS